MNDYLKSSPTAAEATQGAKDLVKLLSLGGFNLTKFVSNNPNILQQIETNSECQPNGGTQLPTTEESSHVLGLKWKHDSDTLVVSYTELLLNELFSASRPQFSTPLDS